MLKIEKLSETNVWFMEEFKAKEGKVITEDDEKDTGITKIVNPHGKVEAQLEPYTKGILFGEIYLNNKTTFYTKYGNLILYIGLIALGILFSMEIKKQNHLKSAIKEDVLRGLRGKMK